METKKKTKRRGLKVLVALTILQWGALYGVNLFLAPEQTTVSAVAQSIFHQEDPTSSVKAPVDADQFRISDDKKLVAYTKGKDLYIDNKDKNLYQKKVGRVTYMQWLGRSNSLVYFVQDSSLTGYIIQASTLKPHQLESWSGTERKIRQAYFNPYMEFLYLETERGNVDEIYKYDAVNGIYKFPLSDIKIDRINFDEKTDTMEIYDSKGNRWDYKNGHLYDPKGNLSELKRIKAPSPTEDNKTDTKSDTKSTGTTESTDNQTKETTATKEKETTKQPTTKAGDSVEAPSVPTKKEGTGTGGLQPPTVNPSPTQGTTTPIQPKQPTTKEPVPSKAKTGATTN